jgi:molybdate transport system substrate-binding protein
MKNLLLIYFLFISCILTLVQCRSVKKEESMMIFCAAGLADVINELSDSFTASQTIKVKINLASSGTLARQLERGNAADIFISANKHWADYVYALDQYIEPEPLYRNSLVVICPLNSDYDSVDFSGPSFPQFAGRLSMGDPDHVPAGQYAKEALINLGWWSDISNRILPSKDVRSALMPVELGECPLGIVYYSDALASKKVKILGVFPESCHTPIIFFAMLSKAASNPATIFYHMLDNSNFDSIVRKYGFTLINASD